MKREEEGSDLSVDEEETDEDEKKGDDGNKSWSCTDNCTAEPSESFKHTSNELGMGLTHRARSCFNDRAREILLNSENFINWEQMKFRHNSILSDFVKYNTIPEV